MYNQEIKERFLDESKIINSTRKYYSYILNMAEKTEMALGKDVYQFSPYECDQLLLSYPRKSEEVLLVIVSVLKRYVDFCEKINLTKDYNYFTTINGSDDVKKYLDMTAIANKYITMEDLREMQKLCRNEQDEVSLELPFNALRGEVAEEILGLRVDQVFPDKIVLKDREIPIEPRAYEIIQDAILQKEYLRGEEDTEAKAQKMIINETDYVLRTAGATKDGIMKYSSYVMRIEKIKRYFGNPYINITNLYHAGMIHRLKERKKLNGTLEKEDYQDICQIFGIGVEKWHLYKNKFELYL